MFARKENRRGIPYQKKDNGTGPEKAGPDLNDTYPPTTENRIMRLSTLQQWSVIIGVFLLVILALPAIAGLASPDGLVQLLTGQPRPGSPAACAGTDLGGFSQDPVTGPAAITRQAGDVTFTLMPVYRYRIFGKIVGKDEYFLTPLDRLGPMDLTIANGDILRPELFPHFSFHKYPRHYSYRYSVPAGVTPLSPQYVAEHVSNNHLIFSDDTVYAAAQASRIGEMVALEGFLVTVTGTGSDGKRYTWRTSTTRADQGEGACELVYVESFRTYPC